MRPATHLLELARRPFARPSAQARLRPVGPWALGGRRRREWAPRSAADGLQLLVQPRRLLLACHEGALHGRELAGNLGRHSIAPRTSCALCVLWPLRRRWRLRRLRRQGRQRGELLRIPLQPRHHLEQRRVGAARLRVAALQLLEVLLQLPTISAISQLELRRRRRLVRGARRAVGPHGRRRLIAARRRGVGARAARRGQERLFVVEVSALDLVRVRARIRARARARARLRVRVRLGSRFGSGFGPLPRPTCLASSAMRLSSLSSCRCSRLVHTSPNGGWPSSSSSACSSASCSSRCRASSRSRSRCSPRICADCC